MRWRLGLLISIIKVALYVVYWDGKPSKPSWYIISYLLAPDSPWTGTVRSRLQQVVSDNWEVNRHTRRTLAMQVNPSSPTSVHRFYFYAAFPSGVVLYGMVCRSVLTSDCATATATEISASCEPHQCCPHVLVLTWGLRSCLGLEITSLINCSLYISRVSSCLSDCWKHVSNSR